MDDDTADDGHPTRVWKTVLTEARRRYDAESQRNSHVEGKIATVVTIDALIISIVGAVLGLSNLGTFPGSILFVVTVFPAIASAWIGLRTLRTREYRQPGKPIDDFHEYLDLDRATLEDELLLAYEVSVMGNISVADSKYDDLWVCMLLTFASLALVGLASLALVGVQLVPLV